MKLRQISVSVITRVHQCECHGSGKNLNLMIVPQQGSHLRGHSKRYMCQEELTCKVLRHTQSVDNDLTKLVTHLSTSEWIFKIEKKNRSSGKAQTEKGQRSSLKVRSCQIGTNSLGLKCPT